MMEPVETGTVGPFRWSVRYDEYPSDPREDTDCNAGRMLCAHGRYQLGDAQIPDTDPETGEPFDGWEDIRAWIGREYPDAVALPLYLYDHSGLSMSVGSADGPTGRTGWDSGQVGYVVGLADRIAECGIPADAVEACLRGEVEQYDQYLRGDVYYWEVTDATGDGLESVGGYYDAEDAAGEARGSAEWYARNLTERIDALDAAIAGAVDVGRALADGHTVAALRDLAAVAA